MRIKYLCIYVSTLSILKRINVHETVSSVPKKYSDFKLDVLDLYFYLQKNKKKLNSLFFLFHNILVFFKFPPLMELLMTSFYLNNINSSHTYLNSISHSSGGRYDNLVGMFSTSGMQTPCVGVSIGIERVFTIIEKKAEELKLSQSSPIQVRNFHFFYAPI